MRRVLIAGFGNVLRGDDGFGIEVIRRLEHAGIAGADVELMEVGTGGLRLAQQLMDRYTRLIVVDAMRRAGPPGTVYVQAVDAVEAVAGIDMHLAVPSQALAAAGALGALPPEIFLIGCEPLEVDELSATLSPPVQRAVETALHHVYSLLREPAGSGAAAARIA